MNQFTHVTHGPVKLGRKRGFKFAFSIGHYMTGAVIAPTKVAWERSIAWLMLVNDRLGCCVIAWMFHYIMAWKSVAHAGDPTPTFTDDQIIAVYSAITGYNPSDPNTDQGTDPDAALAYWKSTGLYGDKIAGYVNLDITDIEQIKWAIATFGGIGLSFDVPAYIMQVPAGESWSEPPEADTSILGGHQVLVIGYGALGFTVVSWGAIYHANWAFWQKYAVAAQVAVSTDWIKQSGTAPSGLDVTTLLADLQQV